MKEIILHGILAKEFGESFKMQISRPKDCIKALDANLNNFINRINDLASQGFHYTIIVDNKKIQDTRELDIQNHFTRIDLVPLIVGSGAVVGGLILTGIASLGGAASAAAMSAFLATGLGSFVATMVGGLVLTAITMGLQMLMQDKQKGPEAVKSTTTAIKQSYDFSNKANVANQGSSIPIGYGRLKVGSQVILYTVKAFQSQISFNDIAKKFNDNNTDVNYVKRSNANVDIGSITVTVVESSFRGTPIYAFKWTTQGVIQLRNNNSKGTKLDLNKTSVSFGALSPRSPKKTFWIKYQGGGTRTFTVNGVGTFTG